MTRKDLTQIYDMIDRLDNIKEDQEFIEKMSTKGYIPFKVVVSFKEPNKKEEVGRRHIDITQECVDRVYDLIKKDIAHQIKEMSNDLDGMVVINTNGL